MKLNEAVPKRRSCKWCSCEDAARPIDKECGCKCHAEYQKIKGPALAEYEKIEAQAWAEYQKIKTEALAEYEKIEAQAWAEYQKIEAQALAEYQKIKGPAWAEYQKKLEK